MFCIVCSFTKTGLSQNKKLNNFKTRCLAIIESKSIPNHHSWTWTMSMDTANIELKRFEVTKLLRFHKFYSNKKILLSPLTHSAQLRQHSDGLLKSHNDGLNLPTRAQCGIQDKNSQEHFQVFFPTNFRVENHFFSLKHLMICLNVK